MTPGKGYTTSKWAGQPLYNCSADDCPFNSTDEEEIKKHVRLQHRQAPEDVPDSPPLGGDNG